jgi:uncharacterized protein (TIGR03118 family)
MQHLLSRNLLLSALAGIVLVMSQSALAQYQLRNLNSNQVGQAAHADPLLANAWGLVHGPGTPWWVSDNNSGWSTLYNEAGQQIQQLKVLIPTAGENGPGSPTGVVFNGSNNFQVLGPQSKVPWPSIFLFAALDGTISGWAPKSNFNAAIVAVDNSKAGSVYTALAISSANDKLYAADIANNKIDVFAGDFTMASFTDPNIPAGFAPFGIQDVNGLVYVTFASVSGGSSGFVDVFKEDGTLANPNAKTALIHDARLDQPWGIAFAPSNFGPLSNSLLISNNTNQGNIVAFNPHTGQFIGNLKDQNGKIIRIDQLWAIQFGGGDSNSGGRNQLYFTAGPKNNLAGTFGVINFR